MSVDSPFSPRPGDADYTDTAIAAPPEGEDNLFKNLPGEVAAAAPVGPRSYFGASARAMGQGLISAAAGAGQAVVNGPLNAWGPPTKGDLMVLYKNDPKGFEAQWNSPVYALQRIEEEFANRATATMGNLTESGKKKADQTYIPFDLAGTGKDYVGPERIAGDLMQSAAQTALTGATVFAAARGGPQAGAIGGALEGLSEGQQARQQTRQELEAAPLAAWQNLPAYQALVKNGWHPEMARKKLIEEESRTAGQATALLSGLIAAGGGAFLGHSPGGGVVKRVLVGGGTEVPVEMGQSAVQQIQQNLAARATIDPKRSVFEDVPEQVAAGGTLGFLQGGGFNAALGRHNAQVARDVAVTDSLGTTPDLAAKRKLPPIASDIITAAQTAGVDPQIALGVASIESGFNPQAVNSIGATGLYQFLPGTMQTYGVTKEQLLADPQLQVAAGVKMLSDASRAVEKATGRAALPGEIYMAQLFGHGGVQSILKAADDESLLKVVKSYGCNEAVLTQNNIPLDSTVGQAKIRYAQIMAAHMGQAVTATTSTVDPQLDQFRSRAARELDSGDVEMLVDKHIKVEKDQAEAAAKARDIATTSDVLDTLDKVQTAQAPQAPARVVQPQLSQEAIDFLNDHAKGLTITSKMIRAARAEGIDLPQGLGQLEMANHVAAAIEDKQVPRVDTTPEQIAATSQTPVEGLQDPLSLLDTGMSEDRLDTRQNTPNPNHREKRENRPVQYGPAEAIGKPLREVALKPGQVVTAAIPYQGAELPYMSAIHDFVQKSIQQFAPTARVILTHESRGDALASQRNLGGGWYQINPTNITRRDKVGGSYNRTAELQSAYSTAHEVGHVIVDHEFLKGLTEAQVAAIESLPSTGYFEESFLKTLPADRATILREYNAVKRSLLDNPKAMAKDFIQRWLSPWKIAHGFDQAKNPAEGWKRYADLHVIKGASRMSARSFAQAMEIKHPNILGVHEYLAEQFSRYAYSKQLVEKTALGQSGWFKETLAMLRNFFTTAKLNKMVAPLQTFEKWLSALPDTAQQPARRAKAEAVPIDVLAADREGATRFDDPESIALRDKLLFDETLGRDVATSLPSNLVFETEEKLPGHLTFNIRERGTPGQKGAIQYYMDVQGNNVQEPSKEELAGWTMVGTQKLNQGHILNTANVTRKYSGLGPLLYDYAAAEAEKRGFTLKSGETTSPSAQKVWERRVADKKAVQLEEGGWRTVPDSVRREALELLAHGQGETAKEVVERAIGKPTITRWDGSLPEFNQADAAMAQVDRIPTARGATRTFMATGLRRLVELKHAFMDIRQMAAVNPHIAGLRYIAQSLTNIEAYRGDLENRSMEVAQKWAKLSKPQVTKLHAFMEKEYASGVHAAPIRLINNNLVHVPDETFAKAVVAAGMDQATGQLFLDIKNQYLLRLKLLQKFMRDRMLDSRDDNPDRSAYWNARMQKLAEAFDRIRATPFHPQTRFGQYVMEVRRNGESQPFHVETFESAEARENAVNKLKSSKEFKGMSIRSTMHDSHTAVMRVLPAQVLDSIGLGGTLTASQRRELFSSLDLITRSAQLRKYSPTLGAITGGSKEHFRVFVDFMHNDALMLSKLAFRQDFMNGLESIRDVTRQADIAGDLQTVAKMESIYKFTNKAVKQILNPAAEYHALRSFVVLHDLWGNIKSAVANLTSIVNTWAGVTKRLGTIQGTMTLGSAAGRVVADRISHYLEGETRAQTEGWAAVYNADERWAMERATKEGHINETVAAQLAGWANAGTLERMGFSQGKRLVDQAMRVGMAPFSIIEQYTRRVTLLTMFDAYMKQGLDRNQAYSLATQDMLLTQGDNSILNRAEIMRGRKSAFLIYYNYMRNMTFLMAGGQAKARRGLEQRGEVPPSKGWGNETARLWMGYFLLGGLMGLPGAEDLDKLVELVAKQLGYRVSIRELAYDLAREVADGAADMGIPLEARSIVHGATSHLPLPGGGAVDISSSVGLGNAVPGMGGIDKLGGRDEDQFLSGLMGPLGRRIQEGMNLFKDSLPPEKQYALAIPSAVGNVIKALQDEPRFYSGGRILMDPRTGQVKDLTTGEVIFQAMGFSPADVSARQELHYMQKEFADYWTTRRNGLMAQVWEAKLAKNQDAIHDTMKAVQEFNSTVPAAGLRITSENLASSYKTHQRHAQQDERGLPPTIGLRPGYRQIQDTVLGRRTE